MASIVEQPDEREIAFGFGCAMWSCVASCKDRSTSSPLEAEEPAR